MVFVLMLGVQGKGSRREMSPCRLNVPVLFNVHRNGQGWGLSPGSLGSAARAVAPRAPSWCARCALAHSATDPPWTLINDKAGSPRVVAILVREMSNFFLTPPFLVSRSRFAGDKCVMHPASPPQPTKALTFDVSCPPGASVDSIFDAATGIVGTAELFSVQHLGATNFQLSVTSSSAMSRIVNAGALSIVTAITCLFLPVYVKSEALAAALAPYGKVLDIRFGVYQDHPTLRTGTRYIRMEMKESTPVPNFLRVSGHRATFDYRGLRRVCRRCQREGHIKAACNVPYCTRCAAFGHDSAGCAVGCGRCGAAHATSLNEFPALASTPRDGPPATPSPAASNAPAPTPAVGPTESTVPSPSESTETTSPELNSTTPQPEPATSMATGEDSNAPAAMLSNAPAITTLNDAETSVPLPTSSRSEEAPVQLGSPTAPEFQSSPSLNWSDLTEGSDEERLVINETAGNAAEESRCLLFLLFARLRVLTLNVQGFRSATKNLDVHLLDARHCLVLGDFNCVVDSRRDVRGPGYGRTTWNARELRRLIGHFDLVDCWTLLHGTTFEHTWQLYVTETLASAVQACGAVDFPPAIGYVSDHRPVLAELSLAPLTGHQRFWRLDSRVLQDPTSRDRLKEVLRRSLLGVTPDPANWDHLLETCRVACAAEGRALRQRQVEELRDTSLRIRIVRRGGAGTPLMRGYLSQLLDRYQRLLRASTTAATVLRGKGGPSFHPEVLRYTHRTQVKERRVPPDPVPSSTPPPGQPPVPRFSSHFESLATSDCSSLPMQRRFTTPS
ncbi:hypothetical protein HPB47_025919 [Ixodes persulcatus]|uniref:Uncharacterized protein n=1 Tax=Ixodes persulcatus TaxID=34615 RepID=A0AC60Q087_IXOPE|nr:hypothetical protein HPB47_025919 [Ixodes persulcatus]